MAKVFTVLGRPFLVTVVLFGLAIGSNDPVVYAAGSTDLPIQDLQLFSEVFNRIEANYVEEVDDSQLLQDAIKGMLNGLDPHSVYLDQDTYREVSIDTQGEFGGVGIEISIENNSIRVVAPIDGTPAHRAGLLPGDRIIRLDNVLVQGMPLDEAVNMMRGEPGTEIRLLIVRDGEPDPIEITLQRAIIRLDSVWSELLDGQFGYVRVSQFQPGTANDLEVHLNLLKKESIDRLDGLVLDLRNNPGGILSSAVAVSDLFLSRGSIVTTLGRSEESEVTYNATPRDILDGAPIVVIVNSGSASASEIVAGALQDHKRAVIMGERTFGKASVQTIFPMENGAALKLTTALYYTPSNRSIQASGIVPDVSSSDTFFAASNEDEGFNLREKDLPGYLENESQGNGHSDNEDVSTKKMSKQGDNQVRHALTLLKSMSIALNASFSQTN